MVGSASDIRAGGAFVELYAEDRALQRGLANAQRKLRAFAQGVTAISRTAFSTGLLGSFGLGEAGKTFANFEAQMLAVRGITQSSQKDFEALWQEAKRLGSQTSFTAQEVADAMTEMARGGFKAEQIINSMSSVLNLARGTMTDLTLATQTTMRIMNQFGLEASEAARVVDVLAIAANNSMTTVEELSEAFVYAGPDMRRNNATMEDTAAMFAVLANAGVNASTAGVQLRRVMRNLSDPAIRKKLKDLFGVELEDEAGNFMGLPKVLDEITTATGRLSSMDVTALFEEMFGRGSNAAAIIGGNKEQFHQLLKAMQEMRGEGGRLAQLMASGLKGAFIKMASAFEGFMLSIGEGMAPTLIKMFEAVRQGLSYAEEWVTNNKAWIVTTLKLVVGMTALGAAGLVVGAGLKGLGFITDLFAKGIKPIAQFTEALASMAPTFYKITRAALHMGDTLYHTLRGIVVQGYALGASWRYFYKYGVEQNPFGGNQMATSIRRTGDVLRYFKDMTIGAANGLKAMFTVTKASSKAYSGQTFTSQLGEGFKSLKDAAKSADVAIQKFFTSFANVASARSLSVLTTMANLLTPVIAKANAAGAAIARFANNIRQMGAAGAAQYAFTGVKQFFVNLPATIRAGTGALNEFGGRIIWAMRNWQQGTKQASLGGFFRGMKGLSRMLIMDIVKADRQMAKFFGNIRRGVRLAVGAFKTLGAAIASALMATVIGIIVVKILEAAKATWDWVRGWKDLNEEVDEFLEKITAKPLTGKATMLQLDDAHMLLSQLGDTANRTRQQTEDLWNAVAKLQAEYGYLGIEVDEATGRITNLGDVLKRLSIARNAEKSFGALKQELDALKPKIAELEQQIDRGNGQVKISKIKEWEKALQRLKDRYSEVTKEMTDYIAAMHAAGMTAEQIDDVVSGRARGPTLDELEEMVRIAEEREKMLEDKRRRAAEERRSFDESIENRLYEARVRLNTKGHEQAMKLLDVKFREEMRALMRIRATKEQQAKLAEAQELERMAVIEELERNHQQMLLDHQDELARLRIEKDYEGHAERMKLLELEEQQAIRAAEERNEGNPREMLEAELKLLGDIYALRREIAEAERDAEQRDKVLREKAEWAKDFYERSLDYAEQLREEQKAAKELADQLRGRSIGGVWGGNRVEQMLTLDRPIEKRQLDALERLIEEEKKTREALQDLNPLSATGIPGIL